jgi:spermidine dehydrogenase
MTDGSDRDLGMGRDIPRRDFVNGALAAGASLGAMAWLQACADAGAPPAEYPPALTGLRGSTDEAFRVAHRLRDGAPDPAWGRPTDTRERYDLVVVGGGISGLAAAHFFRARAGAGARVLVLDNHDDFGGHARRNEFQAAGRLLLGYGGTQSIDTPSSYSPEAAGLLRDLGIDVDRFHQAFDRDFYPRHGLGRGWFLDRETFGADALLRRVGDAPWRDVLARAPLPDAVRRDLLRLFEDRRDHLAGRPPEAQRERLARTSYRSWLLDTVGIAPEAAAFLQNWTHGLYGVGIDAVPAADCRALGFPGFAGLRLDDTPGPGQGLTTLHDGDPYIFHFPDGNASIARLLVARLVPEALPATGMDDVVLARARYDRLDRAGAPVRIRLGSTAIRVAASGPDGPVTVTYVRGDRAYRVEGGACVLACWHGVIPHLMPELPVEQREALRYQVKVPLLYANVALRDWTAFERLGVHEITAPGGYWSQAALDFPVSLGGYRFSGGPAEPIVLTLERTPCRPGLPAREQHRVGRMELLATPFEVLERALREQLARMLGGGGFDPARDVLGLTVNRWAHGYTYEYNSLFDPVWPPGGAPHEIARRPAGRVAIANADAAAFAYTDAAIDQAWRAVRELTTA